MIKYIFVASLLICLLQSSCFSQTKSPSVTRMSNGLTIILQEDHATDLVGVDVWVKAGSINETAKNNGISHFIEHLVFSATSKRDAGDIDREIESLGASLNAHTSRDWAHFNTTVSTRYLPKALELLADALTNAQFRELDIKREGLIIQDEIAKKETEPMKVCKDYLAKELYGTHPYGLPVEGTEESVEKITRQDILDYYTKYYVPSNMAVVLVGDIDSYQATTAITKAFQGLRNPKPLEETKRNRPSQTSQISKSIKSPFKLNYIAMGFIGPSASDFEDVCAIDVLLSYLGVGYRSWMVDELKGKMGLAADVSSDFLTQRDPGMISLIASTPNSIMDKTKDAILTKLTDIKTNGIAPDALSQAKRSILGETAFQNETFGGLANTYGFFFSTSDPMHAAKYDASVQAVKNEDIIRVAGKYLDQSHAVILTINSEQGGSK